MQKRTSFAIFKSVVYALLLREIQTRFGSKKLGYLWAVIDSISMIVVFSIIRSLTGGNIPGVDYPVFLTVSFIAYNLFKNISIKSMNAFSANKALFVYKQVKPFDTIVSRTILEIFISSVSFLLLLGVGWYIGLDIACANIFAVLVGFLWIGVFGFGLGIFFAVVGFFYENFAKIVNLLFLPMLFLSALFYTVGSLPPLAREVILYNPLVHFIEFLHGEYFFALDTQYVDFNYMLLWTLLPFYAGLWLYKRSEKKIIMS